jgi:protease PrsW
MAPALRKSRVCGAVDATLAIVFIGAAFVHLDLLARMDADVVAVFFLALLASTLLSAVPVAGVWFLDRRERETPFLLAGAFLWGGCIATALVLPFNTAFFQFIARWVALNPAVTDILGPDAAILIAAPLAAPIAEEVAKAAGVALIFWFLRDEFDNMRDGFVYGAMVGIGFNWFEAALYVAQGYAQHGVARFGLELGARYALFGFGGHAMFTGLFGLFLGLAMQTQRTWLRIAAPIAGLTLAIVAHTVINALPLFAALAAAVKEEPLTGAPGNLDDALTEMGFLAAFLTGSLVQLTIFVPLYLVIGIALWRSGVWERRVIREELASEVGRSVTPGEYEDIVADGVLRTRRIDGMKPHRSAALVNAQHELAFRKRRVRGQGDDPEQDHLVWGWREDIQRQRQSA